MEVYICENVFVPLRSGPSHKSEMLSQVLFGEKYRIIDESGHWYKIETLFDNYQGWIDKNHIQRTADIQGLTGYVLNRSLLCFKNDKSRLVLEAGCEIYNPDFTEKVFSMGADTFGTCSDFSDAYIKVNESIADTAMRFINSPYIWGGRIPSGIDCSGFTQLVYKVRGIQVPRDSKQQVTIGENVNFVEETKPGDLVFFDDEYGRITHVGMILSSGLVIHASGRVRIDNIDHQGIYKNEIKGYSHKLRAIRRIVT
ncbi:MAG: C40 family peptidase [Bacteroidota bacterium]|nr:C40 family peptidase [Bacteroidota bacterium]